MTYSHGNAALALPAHESGSSPFGAWPPPKRGLLRRRFFGDPLARPRGECCDGGPVTQLRAFDAATREAIALAVANVDECSSCQAAQTAGGKAAGLSEEQMVAVRAGRVDFDPRLSALLALVRDYTGNIGTGGDATWRAALLDGSGGVSAAARRDRPGTPPPGPAT